MAACFGMTNILGRKRQTNGSLLEKTLSLKRENIGSAKNRENERIL